MPRGPGLGDEPDGSVRSLAAPGNGFEHFYGFIGGETNQYAPAIYRDTVPVEPDRTPEEGYHFTEDMTDHAIEWIRQQKALMPDKPFFVYYAPGATHAPHHVPPEWSDKYKGTFDDGWDAQRERTFARQKELGVIPPDAELTARPREIPAWDDMPDDLKPVLARQMEVYAGFLEHTDHHVGRLIDALAELEILDDTLVYAIIGDNGASAEGTLHGTFNELIVLNGASQLETTEFMASQIDEFGTPRGLQPLRGRLGARHGHALPVDQAGRLALGRHAQRHDRALAQRHQGQGRDPQPVPPRHRRRADGPRGRRAARIRRSSTASSRRRSRASRWPTRSTTRRRRPRTRRSTSRCSSTAASTTRAGRRSPATARPWVMAALPALDDDVWELYGPDDWTQAHDLAAEQPEKLAQLQRLFLIEATKYNVLPLDDRRVERFNADLAGRPQLIRGNRQILFGGMGRLSENSVVVLKNKSHAITR